MSLPSPAKEEEDDEEEEARSVNTTGAREQCLPEHMQLTRTETCSLQGCQRCLSGGGGFSENNVFVATSGGGTGAFCLHSLNSTRVRACVDWFMGKVPPHHTSAHTRGRFYMQLLYRNSHVTKPRAPSVAKTPDRPPPPPPPLPALKHALTWREVVKAPLVAETSSAMFILGRQA